MIYTDEQVKLLSQSPYILKVTNEQISYGKLFFQEYWKIIQKGFTHVEAFDFLGLDPDIVGIAAIRRVHSRVKDMADQGTLFNQESEMTLSLAKQLKQKDEKIKRLQQEVEFLKKKKLLDRKYKK